ncbi:MAG TPA: GAF domain-containing sensor histidine kinase [Thermodesulfobacteriota bacterium]|nr:GAF domain-containing sensor histidine kinase [Thermodesulfobacteriota bacterium]
MLLKLSTENRDFHKDRPKGERRKILRRSEDKIRGQAYRRKIRKLQSLLGLGQLIGLDLQLHEMLLKISQKACEVMEADRCSIFLHDPRTDELCSIVALGIAGEVIRISSSAGLIGHCFLTGETINLEDAYRDKRFNKEVDLKTGYHTRSALCMPLYSRSGSRSGVIQLLNKKEGLFTKEDEAFLQTFGNNASVFIEMAQLQRARIDALEQSRKELEELNRVKSKALDHLSHELETPLAIIQGYIRFLKRKIQGQSPPLSDEQVFESLEKNLNRLFTIQKETDLIIRSQQEIERIPRLAELDLPRVPPPEAIPLYPFIERILEGIRNRANHRNVEITLGGEKDLTLSIDPKILEEIMVGLLKNAIENTPDEGLIRIVLEQETRWLRLKVMDYGIGITEENQRRLFGGLFHTLDTELYTSKNPYDFGAGGKGLDLLCIKTYGERFGFDISVESQRCTHIPTDRDLCPGKISECPHCKRRNDCLDCGGSTFCISFPIANVPVYQDLD